MKKTKVFLHDNVRRLRNEKGWSQNKLAEEAGLSFPTIQGIEYKKSDGKANTVAKIAKALGVTMEDLYKDPFAQPEPPKTKTVADMTQDELRDVIKKAKGDDFEISDVEKDLLIFLRKFKVQYKLPDLEKEIVFLGTHTPDIILGALMVDGPVEHPPKAYLKNANNSTQAQSSDHQIQQKNKKVAR